MNSFGKYNIEKQIGIGGTASVYLATHTGLGRKVVLKVMSEELFMQDIDYKKLFIEEAQTIAKLHHPNIIQVYDVNSEDERIYIEMEYLSGGTLKDRIREDLPIDPIKVTREIADALQYVFNANGTIHRDIKPSNILFREEENKLTAVLTDFGISKTQNNDSEFTNIGVRVGTPRYMSPEQLMGGYVDQRSDLYSLGIILYELLSGQLFNKDQTPGVIESFTTPQLPTEYRKFQPIINKLITPNPNDRFNDANDLTRTLSKFDRNESNTNQKTKKTSLKKKLIIPLGLISCIAITGGGFAIYKKQINDNIKRTDLQSVETAILGFKQNDISEKEALAIIEQLSTKYPNEPRLTEAKKEIEIFKIEKAKLANIQKIWQLINKASELADQNNLTDAKKTLSEAENSSTTSHQKSEIKRIHELISTKERDKDNTIGSRKLGTIILSAIGFDDIAPTISNIEEIKNINSWPKLRISNNKEIFIHCLYKSPNDSIFRLHPYPTPKSIYPKTPQKPGTPIDIPLGEKTPGTSTITCIGSEKSLKSEFMSLFDSEFKLDKLNNIEEVSSFLKKHTDGNILIETREIEFN